MAMEMHVEGERLLVARISGTLQRAEFDACQRRAGEVIRRVGTVGALILLDGFAGWDRRDNWGDMSDDMAFLAGHGSAIGKMAIVGEERWREEARLFAGAGLREGEVRYFADELSARAWLARS